MKDALQKVHSSNRSAIDNAINTAIKKGIAAGHYSSGGHASVGAAVEDFINGVVERWRSSLSSTPFGATSVERAVTDLIDAQKQIDGEGRIFQRTNQLMVGMLKKIVFVEDACRIRHLEPILAILGKQKRLVVATLNYDNCVELLAEESNVPCHTGIDQWINSQEFGFPIEGLGLLKLHGSVDWAKSEISSKNVGDGPTSRPKFKMPQSEFRRCTAEEIAKDTYTPAVIFGHRNKLTAEGPFLDLLRAFQLELSKAQLLTVIGYSFGDPHINVLLTQWINSNDSHSIRIVNGPSFGEGYTSNRFVQDLLRLRRDAPEKVSIIPMWAGEG